MKNLPRLSVLLFIVSVLNACATAPGKEFSEISPAVPDKGNVYIYRTGAFFAIAQDFPVFVDGEKKGSLFNKSFLLLHLTPGSHTLKVAPGGIVSKSHLLEKAWLVSLRKKSDLYYRAKKLLQKGNRSAEKKQIWRNAVL